MFVHFMSLVVQIYRPGGGIDGVRELAVDKNIRPLKDGSTRRRMKNT